MGVLRGDEVELEEGVGHAPQAPTAPARPPWWGLASACAGTHPARCGFPHRAGSGGAAPRPAPSAGPADPAPVDHDLAVGPHRPALAEVDDQVPVDGALVRPAGLRIRGAERQMDRPPDLLVEEDRPDGPVDAR